MGNDGEEGIIRYYTDNKDQDVSYRQADGQAQRKATPTPSRHHPGFCTVT